MLHLDTQKGKEDMKTSEFQKYIGGTGVCMKRLVMDTKECDQLTWNETYFSDSWFSSVKNAEEMVAAGVDYCGPVKTSHKGFCLATSESLMKDWSGGPYIVMESTPRVTGGSPLLDIGYMYNSRKFLWFIATDGAGSTTGITETL